MHTSYYQVSPGQYLELFGIGHDRLEAGMRIVHRPGLTLSQHDNVQESLETGNAAMLHYDHEYARHTAFGQPLMVSTVTLQRLIGMTTKTFGLGRARIDEIAQIALKRPVFGGDTLYAESTVRAVQRAGGAARVELDTAGINQRGEQVASIVHTFTLCSAAVLAQRFAPGGEAAMQARFASHAQRADGAWVEQTGLFFEDLAQGESFVHFPRRQLDAHEARRQARLSLDLSPGVQGDPLYAGGERIPQTWVISLVAAMSTRTFGRVTANLAWTDIRFGRSPAPGDWLQARSTVLECRPSTSRPNEGVVKVRTEAFDQYHEPVLSYDRTLLVYRRDADTPYHAAGY